MELDDSIVEIERHALYGCGHGLNKMFGRWAFGDDTGRTALKRYFHG
jgi:hypothetical protein